MEDLDGGDLFCGGYAHYTHRYAFYGDNNILTYVAQMSCYIWKDVKDMSKTATIRARIEPNLKEDVEKLFKKMGLTTTEAINLFYR
jgi:hypothetical protein